MTIEGKFVFNTHIYSSRKFLFTFCLPAPLSQHFPHDENVMRMSFRRNTGSDSEEPSGAKWQI